MKELELPYTFIEVGWWFQLLFPWPHAIPETLLTPKFYVGDREKKVLYTSLKSIALFVARIINDPRTLNQTVITSDGEASLNETWPVAEKVSGEDFSDYPRVCILVLRNAARTGHSCTIYRYQMRNFWKT